MGLSRKRFFCNSSLFFSDGNNVKIKLIKMEGSKSNGYKAS